MGSAWSFVFFYPRHNGQWPRLGRISIPDVIHYIFVLSLFFWKKQYFPFYCWTPNKGTDGTIFITSLVWRGPWLGIEPGTSRTRSQHSTTRLSRMRSLTGDWTRDLPHSKPALDHSILYMKTLYIFSMLFINQDRQKCSKPNKGKLTMLHILGKMKER